MTESLADRPKWLDRCDRCNWPLYDNIEEGCTEDSCSERPLKPIFNQEQPPTRTYIRALEAENTTLRQAIQNTLDTGMDRYIKEIDKRMTK